MEAEVINAVLSGTRQWGIAQSNVMDGLKSIPDGVIQCVVTSPP